MWRKGFRCVLAAFGVRGSESRKRDNETEFFAFPRSIIKSGQANGQQCGTARAAMNEVGNCNEAAS